MKISYTEKQLKYIILLMAVRTPDINIMANFRQKYVDANGYPAPIYGEDLDEIREVYSEEIQETARKELSDNNAVACAFSRVRLEVINKAIFDCLTPKFLGSSPVTKQEGDKAPVTFYQEKVGIDHANLAKMLDLAQKEDFFARKLRLEKLTRGITASDAALDGPATPIVTVYTGYDDPNTRLLTETVSDDEVIESESTTEENAED